ncbi:WhiB family transcriptional regulator [Nocardioides sp. CER19]|uniref:WhiB family transcriptional regulator n=1 Tax=Nocardioides sp. CER19 TaxID=3038538 RepID=UPI0024475611|nr:WhiB family transcriptional regulator [Nocardioides sp. CER19]MDH2415577.1 WhiB family transcriptional regulator [Nocardioides sp. CER19]
MRTRSLHDDVLTGARGGDWRQLSRCRDEPPDVFFPIGHGPAAKRQAERAKRFCAECEVQRQCLAWALHTGIADGVFGGLDEDERRTFAARVTP